MRIRLYIDEDAMFRALVQGLRARDVDVSTVAEANMTGQPDEAQLDWATLQERVIYTFNVADFCRLHKDYAALGRPHAGIIVVHRRRYSVGEQIRWLCTLIKAKSAGEMRNNLEFLSET